MISWFLSLFSRQQFSCCFSLFVARLLLTIPLRFYSVHTHSAKRKASLAASSSFISFFAAAFL